MTSSMTAFARQEAAFAWGTLVWEIRSVNHRFLEPSFRIHDSLRQLEPALREILRNTIKRGKVECSLKFTPSYDAGNSININDRALQDLTSALDAVRNASDSSTEPNPVDILKWPGIVQEQEKDTKVIEQEALELFRNTLKVLSEHREREGAEMETGISSRLGKLKEITELIGSSMPKILQSKKDRLKEQYESLKLESDPTRLEQELVLLVQKADIEEEIDRLQVHITETLSVLQKREPKGRKLDFLMQELNREANTICSKAFVTETTHNAVELKVLIEQIREQVQNIE